MKRTRLTPVLLLVSLLVAACGGGSVGPSAGSASPTSPSASTSSSSTETSSAAPSATASVAGYMGSAPLAAALLPTKSMPGAKRTNTWHEDYPDAAPTSGYAETWLTFVSGSGACNALLKGHPFTPGSSVGQTLRSSHLSGLQTVSSMQTEADAKALMAQNISQLKYCTRFKGRLDGRTYTFQHAGMVAKQSLGGEQTVTHRITTDLGNSRIVLWMMESRLGGEVMFLNLNPTDPTGAQQYTMVAMLALSRFTDSVGTYRASHPRTT